MEANEIRIGNWVNYTRESSKGVITGAHTINGIKHSNGWYVQVNDTWTEFPESIEPIELTEVWLLKFGFEKRLGKFIGSRFTLGINPRTEDFILIIEQVDNTKQEFFYLNSFHPIKYIHQLQNLYFALTQTELTLTV